MVPAEQLVDYEVTQTRRSLSHAGFAKTSEVTFNGSGSGSALPSAEPLSAAVPEPATGVLFCRGTIAAVIQRDDGNVSPFCRRPQRKVVMKRQMIAARSALTVVALPGDVR
jgi:hypothetical protein